MTEFVEGEWNNFIFKMATPDSYPKILAALRRGFYRDEPLCKLVGYSEEFADEIDKFVMYYLEKEEGLTFYVEEKGTGKVAGVRVTSNKHKNDPDPNIDISHPNVIKVLAFLDEVSKNSDIYTKYNVENQGYFLMTCVDPDFRGKGLVTEIYKRSIAMLRAKGFPVCSSLFSSPFTRKAAKNLNFSEIYTLHFNDFLDDHGQRVLPDASPDDACACMALKLN